MTETSTALPVADETDSDLHQYWPRLTVAQWIVFAVLAGVLAAVNIYSTLLIGWGDGGSILAVLASVFLLGLVTRQKADVYSLNLGQTMASAGGSVGFAVASYAAVRIIEPTFDPPWWQLVPLFAAMGVLGAVIGSTVRKQMVHYYFPSGTACAVIQRSVTHDVAPGHHNRPIFMLKLWGGLSMLATIPTKITGTLGGAAFIHDLKLSQSVGLGVDPLLYGIGVVVGPRIGLGMAIGSLSVPFLLDPLLTEAGRAAEIGDWVRWMAIALLTLPTFAAIAFAFVYRHEPILPPGFSPGAMVRVLPANRKVVYGVVTLVTAGIIGWTAQAVFAMPWYATMVIMLVAWPLCVVNGRVAGETDINPVRLVAVVLLSGFFWLVAGAGAITMLGMAVVGGTLASVAVDMMQDYRTGYLVDANPTHQTTVQFVGAVVGAVIAVPILSLLIAQLGIGDGSGLPAPGAKIWAAMAEAMSGGFQPSAPLLLAFMITSVAGCGYAFLTVWPKTADFTPSLFGMGIGLLLGTEACLAILAGGLIKWIVTVAYARGKSGDARDEAQDEAVNDTLLAGASVFAAGAIIAIVLIVLTPALNATGLNWWYLAR